MPLRSELENPELPDATTEPDEAGALLERDEPDPDATPPGAGAVRTATALPLPPEGRLLDGAPEPSDRTEPPESEPELPPLDGGGCTVAPPPLPDEDDPPPEEEDPPPPDDPPDDPEEPDPPLVVRGMA
jgi:hypothetical protein